MGWFDISPMLPSWSALVEDHWWSIIVAMIAIVAVPLGVLAVLNPMVAIARTLMGLFGAYDDGVQMGRQAVAHRMGERAGIASGYMDVLGESWYEGPGMSMSDVEEIEGDVAMGEIPVSGALGEGGSRASDAVLTATIDEEDGYV